MRDLTDLGSSSVFHGSLIECPRHGRRAVFNHAALMRVAATFPAVVTFVELGQAKR
jgi:hypothetical protein